MKRHRHPVTNDFREFVFTASGKDIDLNNVSPIDVADNLAVETEKIFAIGDLLESATDSIEPRVASGLGLVLKDSTKRIEAVLRAGLGKKSEGHDGS